MTHDIDTPPEPDAFEVLGWYDAAKPARPDSEITVLLQLVGADGGSSVDTGFWDGEGWRLAESGGQPTQRVAYWAQAEGPDA